MCRDSLLVRIFSTVFCVLLSRADDGVDVDDDASCVGSKRGKKEVRDEREERELSNRSVREKRGEGGGAKRNMKTKRKKSGGGKEVGEHGDDQKRQEHNTQSQQRKIKRRGRNACLYVFGTEHFLQSRRHVCASALSVVELQCAESRDVEKRLGDEEERSGSLQIGRRGGRASAVLRHLERTR